MYIMSQDGKTLGRYQLLTVKKIHGGRNAPHYALFGYFPSGSTDQALFSDPTIGYYDTEEQAKKELADIYAAIDWGAKIYRVKGAANVENS